jgi:hypothetical protein
MKTSVLCTAAAVLLLLFVAGDAFGQCANGRCLLPRIRPQAASVTWVVNNTVQMPDVAPAMPEAACGCSAPAAAVTTNVTAVSRGRTIRNAACKESRGGGLLRRIFRR